MAQDGMRPDWGHPGKLITDGLQAGLDEVIGDAAETMLRRAPAAGRFVLNRIPGAPGLVVDIVEYGRSKDKLRKVAGVGGRVIGGAAGGALGAATGPGAPVAVPIGAAVGSVAGEHIAEEIYDAHAEAIRRMATKAWIGGRNAAKARLR